MSDSMRKITPDIDIESTTAGEDLLPRSCELCPRRCGANRRGGQKGACGADDRLLLARAALHEWEEPPISVGAGSGTVFFSNCPLRCVYCQNYTIADGTHGNAVSPDRLKQIFFELAAQGAANINLVTPTHYLPYVLHSISRARSMGFALPFICNTSGYETVQTVKYMSGAIDAYLTDFKYWRDGESDAARRYSNAPDYFEVASAALRTMVECAGSPRFDTWPKPAHSLMGNKDMDVLDSAMGKNDGNKDIQPEWSAGKGGQDCMRAVSCNNLDSLYGSSDFEDGEDIDHGQDSENRLVAGVVVRHLILPGGLEDSKRIMAYLWAEYGNSVLYSVMNQYTPVRQFPQMLELDRRVADDEYERLLDYMDSLGMTDYFWQEGGAAEESFIPCFDCTGV